MKTILFIVSTLLAVQLQFGLAAPNKEMFMKVVEKCKEKESITDNSIVDALQMKKLPETEKGKCLLACLLEEFGVIVNNSYNKEGALNVATTMLADKPDKLEKAKAAIEACLSEVADATLNRCELAYTAAKCTKTHGDDEPF